MDLTIRSLENRDSKEQIFELCKQNNLTSVYYATDNDVWAFQYENNPLNKSWNAVLADKENNRIYGHMGLAPQVIRAFSSDWSAGLINNGVVNSEVRNKLLPFNNKKTFAITPLIDHCVKEAFEDNVDFCIANSTIHPLIWKTLGFDAINVECKSTIHASLKGLFKAYFELFNAIYKDRVVKVFAVPYAISLVIIQIFGKIGRLGGYSDRIKAGKLVVNRIDQFDDEFTLFFNDFYQSNPEVITCKRDVNFLNWKFRSSRFGVYTFRVEGKLIGYTILEKNADDNSRVVLDYVILDEYLSYGSLALKKVRKLGSFRISFLHYLSCNYTQRLFKQCLKHGFPFTLNPLIILGIDKKKRHITSTLYYKFNGKSKISVEQNELFYRENWFITPILFNHGCYQ